MRSSSRRALVVIAAFAMTSGSVMLPAQGATEWTIRPAPPALGGNQLVCLSQTDCRTATGITAPTGGERPAVERWDGAHWTVQEVPLPPGPQEGWVVGLDCLGASFCAAVGARAKVPLVAIWSGGAWRSRVPVTDTYGQLLQVDCTTTTNCVAVGYTDHPDQALAIHWNGRRWTRDALPAAAGPAGQLTAVSCSSASNCVAVGQGGSLQLHPTGILIERWNGRAWNDEIPQPPRGDPSAVLDDVSCPSDNACYAVGASFQGGLDRRYMQHWDGKRWATVTTPGLSGWQEDGFGTLTCTVTVCNVTGGVADTTGTYVRQPFIERGTTKGWTIETAPRVGDVEGLGPIACPASTCYAIGSIYDHATNTAAPIFAQRTG